MGEEVVSETTLAPWQISVPSTDGVHHDSAGSETLADRETFLTTLVRARKDNRFN